MAKLIKEKHFCCVCKRLEEYEVLAECAKNPEVDMDTRPYGEARALGRFGIQQCPYCGYANIRVDLPIENIDVTFILSSEQYKKLSATKTDDSARKFMLAAYLYEKAKEYDLSAYLYLKAAWMLDDAGETENAIMLRKRSLVSFALLEQNIETIIVEVDLLRRSGGFKEARKLIAHAKKLPDITDEQLNCLKIEAYASFWKKTNPIKRPVIR